MEYNSMYISFILLNQQEKRTCLIFFNIAAQIVN